ncbi:Bax inhibitor-1/YccA family protein [Streptomyces sp. NPDC049813]|uniref:Bax inhibitor-1/YccA family membrane protein n=1 Tax=Streptomyces sp. NPDC049813 TaxID=3365597 RepID=UPI0037874589
MQTYEKQTQVPVRDSRTVANEAAEAYRAWLMEERALASSNPVLSRRLTPRREAGSAAAAVASGPALTVDAVLGRTAAAAGAAALTAVWALAAPPIDPAHLGASYGLAGGAGLAALALGAAQYLRRRPAPALILVFAAFQGLFLATLATTVSTHFAPGALGQTVLGTLAVLAVVLLASRRGLLRAPHRVRAFAGAAVAGVALLAVADVPLTLLTDGAGTGFRSGVPGLVLGVVGAGLAAAFLSLHLRQVERAVAGRVPADRAWTAAFGLVLTLVWLYVETVRLLTLVREDDAC